MKNRLIYHKILLFITVITILIGAVIITKTNREITVAYYWKSLISNLVTVDSNINFLIKTAYAETNFDNVMALGEKFEKDLNDILKIDSLDTISLVGIDLADVQRLKTMFNEKFDYIYTYNSIVSLAKSHYTNLLHNSDSKYFEEIASRFVLFKYDVGTDLKSVKEKIEKYLAKENLSERDKAFLESAKILATYYEQSQYVLNRIYSVGVRLELNDLASQNQSYIIEITARLEDIIVVLVVFLGLICAGGFLAFYDTRKTYRFANYLKQAFDGAFGSIALTDKNRNLIYANKFFLENYGDGNGNIPKVGADLINLDDNLKRNYLDITKAVSENRIWQNTEFVNTSRSGDLLYENVKITPLYDDFGCNDGYILVRFDRTKEVFAIKELEKRELELERRAYVDNLTGLGNYHSLVRTIEEREIGTIIYVSINNFIDFRFFYNAETINLIIQSFAKSLKLCIDTYRIKAEIYRVQFDEFYIYYSGDNVRDDIERIREYVRSDGLCIIVNGKKESVSNITTTIGVSLPQDTAQTNRVTQAMLAHYEAKEKGDPIYYYAENSAAEKQYHDNQIMTKTLEYAIYGNNIIVECQPIYDVSGDEPRVHYYEILVRLIDESGKIRYPGEFLEIAKKISLYNDITKKVIEHTFRLIERFPNTSFSMNLSSSDIENYGIRELLEQKLKICSYPQHLYFEILESEGVRDYQMVNDFIQKMRGYNTKISIDDFGSGYSNYYRILELDVDTIKIDGSLIKKLPFDKNARDLLSTIIDFAEHQDYNIVAEFVSTPEILAEVKKAGIKYAQGFLLGKPISPDAITQQRKV